MSNSPFGGPYTAQKLMAPREDGGYGLGDDAMAMRMMAVRDPIWLAANLLGLKLIGKPSPEHRRVADLIVQQRNYMFLHHRGSFKTSLSCEAGSIHQWVCHPNDRILFLQASLENGKALAKQLRRHLKGEGESGAFTAVFPEYHIKTSEESGQVMSFSTPCRTRNTREASLEIGTPDANLSGRHYDVLVGSDISNEQTSPPPCGRGTVEEAIKLRNWLATIDGLLESKVANSRAHVRIDGTRWGDMDIYNYIIENDVKNRYEKVIGGVKVLDGKFHSSVPGFTHEILQEIRERPTMSAALWAANFMNEPVLDEGAMRFLPGWFHPYDKTPDILDVAITVDPAWTEQEKNPEADRSAIVVSGVDPVGNLYVLAIRAGRWSPSTLLDHLYALIATWSPSWVGIESGTQSVSLIETFTNELHRQFPFVPFRELPPKGKNKLVRAVPLHTHAEKRGIYVKPGEHDELVQELLKFPGGKYKDLVDALAYRAQDLVVPHALSVLAGQGHLHNPRNLMTGDDVFKILAQRNVTRDQTPWDAVMLGRRY